MSVPCSRGELDDRCGERECQKLRERGLSSGTWYDSSGNTCAMSNIGSKSL
jgi:hypothetical protein